MQQRPPGMGGACSDLHGRALSKQTTAVAAHRSDSERTPALRCCCRPYPSAPGGASPDRVSAWSRSEPLALSSRAGRTGPSCIRVDAAGCRPSASVRRGFCSSGSARHRPCDCDATYAHAPPTQSGASVDPADVSELVSRLARSGSSAASGRDTRFRSVARLTAAWTELGDELGADT